MFVKQPLFSKSNYVEQSHLVLHQQLLDFFVEFLVLNIIIVIGDVEIVVWVTDAECRRA